MYTPTMEVCPRAANHSSAEASRLKFAGVMKLLIVDDHEILREGVKALLLQSAPGSAVLQAGSCAQALALIEFNRDLDIVLLDLALPGMGGMKAISVLGKLRPDLPIVVLSASEDPQTIKLALAQGAMGYIPKASSPKTLVSALQFVLEGNVYVPPLLFDETAALLTANSCGNAPRKDGSLLTERQIEVLKLIEIGLSNKAISRKLGLSEKTVKVHVTAIFKTLNVANRTQAVSVARQGKLI
jgi:two-component system, NarL family, nitrate/nitrite response regulator NarL